MTDIIRLTDDEQGCIPKQSRMYAVTKDSDELIAIEKFYLRYGKAPEKAYRWWNNLYVEVEGWYSDPYCEPASCWR